MPSAHGSPVRRAAATVALLVIGVAVRVALLALAPPYGFTGDHVDYVCWGRQIRESGVRSVYRTPPGTGERLNYPPFAAYAFWLSGALHAHLDPAAVANTVASRAAYAVTTTFA